VSKTIVLIRHGKAEAPQEGQPDAERTLTKAGKRSLERSLPDALAPLAGLVAKRSTTLLVSPYIRARQTAKLVCVALGLDLAFPEKCPVLAGDDARAIVDTALARPEDLVILVGHTPTLDKATQLLCGTRMPLKPGAVVCLDMVDEFRGADNLRWFAQGPLVARWERRLRIEDEAARLGKALGRCYGSFVDDPQDVNVVDELHATIRSLRALLSFASVLLKRKPTRSAMEDLDALAELTSRLHAVDLLARRIAASDNVSDELVGSLAARRTHEAENALSRFAARKSQRALDNVRAFARQLPWKTQVAEEGIGSGVLEDHFHALYDEYSQRRESFDPTDEQDVFAAYRQVSQLLSVVGAVKLPSNDHVLEERLYTMQSRLGELREARTTLDIIDEGPLAELSPEASNDLAQLRQQETQRARQLEAQLR
jgi:phosphohistidine phosphatase